jgi:hypothetical protein
MVPYSMVEEMVKVFKYFLTINITMDNFKMIYFMVKDFITGQMLNIS